MPQVASTVLNNKNIFTKNCVMANWPEYLWISPMSAVITQQLDFWILWSIPWLISFDWLKKWNSWARQEFYLQWFKLKLHHSPKFYLTQIWVKESNYNVLQEPSYEAQRRQPYAGKQIVRGFVASISFIKPNIFDGTSFNKKEKWTRLYLKYRKSFNKSCIMHHYWHFGGHSGPKTSEIDQ